MTLFLSRVRLSHAPDVAALARILLPDDTNARVAHGHRLLWSLFADAPDRERDFLWREDGGDTWRSKTFLVLSQRPPEDRNGLFDIETKDFALDIAPSQRLGFRLRASPSVSVAAPGGRRGVRTDPVALALKSLAEAERREKRFEILQQEGRRWLVKQGERAGFRVPENAPFIVNSESHRRLLRGRGAEPIQFPVLDFEGVVEIVDPDAFLPALSRGFGRAKAFGCGLMLLRRI